MSYKSPIEVVQSQMQNQIEGEIYRAVTNIGVYVDKDELLKALEYDRNQYQKGYKDRDDEIVRCENCKAWKQYDDLNLGECELYPEHNKMGNWFCNFGKRKEGR